LTTWCPCPPFDLLESSIYDCKIISLWNVIFVGIFIYYFVKESLFLCSIILWKEFKISCILVFPKIKSWTSLREWVHLMWAVSCWAILLEFWDQSCGFCRPLHIPFSILFFFSFYNFFSVSSKKEVNWWVLLCTISLE